MAQGMTILGQKPDKSMGEAVLGVGNQLQVAITGRVNADGIPVVTEYYARPGENVTYRRRAATSADTYQASDVTCRVLGIVIASVTTTTDPMLTIRDQKTGDGDADATIVVQIVPQPGLFPLWGMTCSNGCKVVAAGVSAITYTIAIEPVM